jgi:hypothetical protein
MATTKFNDLKVYNFRLSNSILKILIISYISKLLQKKKYLKYQKLYLPNKNRGECKI